MLMFRLISIGLSGVSICTQPARAPIRVGAPIITATCLTSMASLLAPLLVLFIAQARFLVAERGRFLPSRRLRLLPGPASGPADSFRSTATGRRPPSPPTGDLKSVV